MKQVVIENPILNSPFDKPRRHFRFTDEGITEEIVDERRVSIWRAGGKIGITKTTRALRAEIDETAWSALYSTKSLPFDPPKSGKIAVKVINHYGDEVLKVYEVG